jgi:hypothetical protein
MKKIDWIETDLDIFEAVVVNKGIEYKVCVESAYEKWIYTIVNDDMDLPVCSLGSYDTKEEAQETALEEIYNV